MSAGARDASAISEEQDDDVSRLQTKRAALISRRAGSV
jgi:hypothetical protein